MICSVLFKFTDREQKDLTVTHQGLFFLHLYQLRDNAYAPLLVEVSTGPYCDTQSSNEPPTATVLWYDTFISTSFCFITRLSADFAVFKISGHYFRALYCYHGNIYRAKIMRKWNNGQSFI